MVLSPQRAVASQPTMTLSASSVDGLNSGTARLGMHVQLTPVVSGSSSTSVTWSMSGAGSITTAGLYSAPDSGSVGTTVKFTATLDSTPAVSATYTLTIVNPVPSITKVSPAALPRGTSTVALTGWGFIPGTVVYMNGAALPTTYVSISQVNVQVTLSSTATGSVSFVAVNGSPSGGTSPAVSASIAAIGLTLQAQSAGGLNTGSVTMGLHMQLTPVVTGTTSTAVTYSLSGAGTLTSAGLYTAPASGTAGQSITVKAALTSDSSVTASYTFELLNPAPVLTKLSVSSLPKGTTTVLVAGSGFIPSTTVLVSGKAVATSYVSPYEVSAPVTVSTSGVSIATYNAGPGGGTSSAIQVPLSGLSMTLNATSADGANTHTGRLGLHVQLTPVITGTTSTAVTWTLSGPGTISSAGLYTAPSANDTGQVATVTAALTSDPTTTATYAITLINPAPSVYSFTPTSLTSTSNTVSVVGAQMVPGTTVLINGSAVATTYVSWNKVTAVVPGTAGENTTLSMTVQNPSPGGGSTSAYSLPISVPGGLSVSPASLPINSSTITVTGTGFSSSSVVWVNSEAVPTTYVSATKLTATAFVPPWRTAAVTVGVGNATSASDTVSVPVVNQTAVTWDAAVRFSYQAAFGPRPDVVAQIQQEGFDTFLTQQFAQPVSTYPVESSSSDLTKIQFFYNALGGSNLLRQRVAFALEEFITASEIDGYIYPTVVPWQTLMEKDAFANFRTLMNDVTLNATMGYWLNLGNDFSPLNPAQHPNQNYAREFMQLFTIGPVMLNDDGSQVLDSNGKTIATYDTANVLDMSRALTGWANPANDSSATAALLMDFGLPLQANESRHDTGSKTLLGNVTLPAGQTITEDLKSALDTVFNHQNVPPFISKLLIQHLVKSDPSPEYIERISKVFENDGTGVRGNLQAVVRAILLDTEARAGDSDTVAASDGHLQEPILYFLAVMSGVQTTPTTTALVYTERSLGEHIWNPNSVFSFYQPTFDIPGTTINAPEFQLYDSNYLPQRSQVLYSVLEGTQLGFNKNYQTQSWLFSHFSNIPDLLDAVDHLFFHGTMPTATKSVIENYVASVPTLREQQVEALYLALNSDSFQISH
ncbi:DUF1800 family protein [Silvibacterium sp.]|uniref:DUF1800 family protein n=1 Tax=Silvibacterium sp. TaxID=1964179 RepID=UPI0039E27CDD